ncbi:MAG: hypothetical protein HY791_35060 [Deltaproteobacteria bacterium]|nr:hypothetical protein [Deltaproteobacteria bacterium]
MKSRLTFAVSALSLILSIPAAFAAEKKVVAVLPFGSPNEHSLGEMGNNAQPTFITQLIKSQKVRVVDEKRADDAVKRFEKEMTGLFDPQKVRQIGRFLKADYVLAGKLSVTGDAFTMTIHVTNVETLEIEMADDVDFRDVNQFRVAVRTSADKIAALIAGEARAEGKHEAFLNIDARAFHDTAEVAITALKDLDAWRYEGKIDSEDPDNKTVHVSMSFGVPKPGMPLQIFAEGIGENDKPIGVVYVMEPDEKGPGGFVAKYMKEKDPGKKKKGDFGLGARVSNARYRYRIALGPIDDLAEGNAKLVDMFREKLIEQLGESKEFSSVDSSQVKQLGMEKKYKPMHAEGVDFVLVGQFLGAPGQRRAEFKVVAAMTGEVWGNLKFETSI